MPAATAFKTLLLKSKSEKSGLILGSSTRVLTRQREFMENPREEIKDVVRGLVCKPTLERQEEVLRRYFSPDVEFFHFNINDKGLSNLIANFQMTELLVNYQDVTFHHIAYDAGQHVLALHMSVGVRPLPKLFFRDSLHFHMLLELEERPDPVDGRTKHYIRVQRDFFLRDPVVQVMPLIGTVYNSDKLRLLLGRSFASLFKGMRFLYCSALPTGLQKSLYHLWLRGPHGKPNSAGAAGANEAAPAKLGLKQADHDASFY